MDDLPAEVITHLLKYLSMEDRLQMAMVNKKFHYASLHPRLIMNDLFCYDETILFHPLHLPTERQLRLKFSEFSEILLNSRRTFIHLKYYVIGLDDIVYAPLIRNLGDRIVSLSFIRVRLLSDEYLDSITNCCHNLQELELVDVDTCSLTDKVRKPLLKLYRITFNEVVMSDVEFNLIVQCTPNLKDFGLYNCDVLEWPQAIRRFYVGFRNPQSPTDYNSRSVFTIENIKSFLESRKNIDSLRLNKYYSIFLQLPKYIKLKTLVFESLTRYPHLPIDDNFIKKLGEQTSLERLELHTFPCTLLSAVSKMLNLKYLKIYYTSEIHVFVNEKDCLYAFFQSMGNLKHIRELIFAPSRGFSDICLKEIQIPDCVLKSLILLNCSIENCINVIHLGRNLTTLNIQKCNVMTLSEFQLLFNNLTNLMHIGIDDCIQLDDDAFSALNVSNIKGLVTFNISDANLTYRCLKSITFLHLRVLSISWISSGDFLNATMSDEVFPDFQHVLKEFASSVPNLTNLTLALKPYCVCDFGQNGIHVNLLKPYCPRLKEFIINSDINIY